MNGLYTIILLILSNVFMTLAWYGHLKIQETGLSRDWPLIGVIVFSWSIAFLEYCCQVPANRIGYDGNGGPFSLVPAQGDSRMRQSGRVCHYSQHPLPRPELALEPHSCFSAHYLCSLSCVYEIV